ncbi:MULTISPECIES: zinc ABC transporter permease subunit ZnuB [Marinimicrobium]|jgi:zinc transport system permease protein|uniref:High-affinity zinc uptake system membrane protein ZnuB n=1 Tax=Marinimicrobium koreense TaxID=306545 RepID=A0A3N1NPP0_9GAMM|nr:MULTISPECIES: zinc ABC transporter permease subunit ZnuB [Marinimicrobium]MAN51438.1 zinc ABC transporter permease [Marinimicrobium sp.]ROQ18113.1 zinc transport system permease protein [Marinimicrobium koreense]
MPDFLLYALLAGLGVTLVAGPLGALVVWRRMAYFGDTLAHSALLGVTFGLLLNINLNLAVALGCLLLALILVALQHNRFLATDTLLGILSHSTLALGLVMVSLFTNSRIDLLGYLFGDILSASAGDVVTIWVISVLVSVLLFLLWRPLLAITVHEDLARVEGVPVTAVRTALMLLMALVIAIAMKVVGVLLITALLIIPAATSRRLTHTPETMALGASLLGALSVLGGLAASFYWDSPAGPSIVLCATGLFVLSLLRRAEV